MFFLYFNVCGLGGGETIKFIFRVYSKKKKYNYRIVVCNR